jgi:hypothetical protein
MKHERIGGRGALTRLEDVEPKAPLIHAATEMVKAYTIGFAVLGKRRDTFAKKVQDYPEYEALVAELSQHMQLFENMRDALDRATGRTQEHYSERAQEADLRLLYECVYGGEIQRAWDASLELLSPKTCLGVAFKFTEEIPYVRQGEQFLDRFAGEGEDSLHKRATAALVHLRAILREWPEHELDDREVASHMRELSNALRRYESELRLFAFSRAPEAVPEIGMEQYALLEHKLRQRVSSASAEKLQRDLQAMYKAVSEALAQRSRLHTTKRDTHIAPIKVARPKAQDSQAPEEDAPTRRRSIMLDPVLSETSPIESKRSKLAFAVLPMLRRAALGDAPLARKLYNLQQRLEGFIDRPRNSGYTVAEEEDALACLTTAKELLAQIDAPAELTRRRAA